MKRSLTAIALALAVAAALPLLLPADPARAKALQPAECNALDAEARTLEVAGVKADMEKGVEWGKANLAADRMERIKHYLEVREKVLFRCPSIAKPDAAGTVTAAKGKKGKVAATAGSADAEASNEFVIVVPGTQQKK